MLTVLVAVMDMVLAAVRECLFCFKNIIMDHPCEHLLRMQPCTWMVLLLLVNYFSPQRGDFCWCLIAVAARGNAVARGNKAQLQKADLLHSKICPRNIGFS